MYLKSFDARRFKVWKYNITMELTEKYIRRHIGDPREIAEGLEQFQNDAIFFDHHERALTENYPDEYVALYKEHVVAHGRKLDDVVRDLRRMGYHTGKVYLQRTYVNEKRPTFILAAA